MSNVEVNANTYNDDHDGQPDILVEVALTVYDIVEMQDIPPFFKELGKQNELTAIPTTLKLEVNVQSYCHY